MYNYSHRFKGIMKYFLVALMLLPPSSVYYRIAGMFGTVNVWRTVELKEIGEIKFGKLIDFIHKDAIYMLNFGWLKFGEPRTTRQIHQTFPLDSICLQEKQCH